MNKINFENSPSTNTPISAENLNLMQTNIDAAKVEKSGDTMTGALTFENKTKFDAVKKARTVNGKDYIANLGVGADGSASLEVTLDGTVLGRIDIKTDGTIVDYLTKQKLIEENEIYYRSGDTYTSNATSASSHSYSETCSGSLTSANCEILFSIKTPKSLKNVSSIAINKMNVTVRSIEKYIFSKTDVLSTYNVVAYKVNDNTIGISIHNSNGFTNFENNTPVSVELMDVSLSFT